MGVFTDFILAARDEGEQVRDAEDPIEDFGGFSANGPFILELAELCSIITEQSWDSSTIIAEDFIGEDPDEPWCFRLPDEFVRGLANLGQNKIDPTALAWASACETPLAPDIASDLVTRLSSLAKEAVAADKTLFVRTCL